MVSAAMPISPIACRYSGRSGWPESARLVLPWMIVSGVFNSWEASAVKRPLLLDQPLLPPKGGFKPPQQAVEGVR